MAIDVESLKSERDTLKESLKELEAEQRKLEGELKTLRQKEIRTKREIEAMTTLIEISEVRDGEPKPQAADPGHAKKPDQPSP